MSALFSGFAGLGLYLAPATLPVKGNRVDSSNTVTAQPTMQLSSKARLGDDVGVNKPVVRQLGDDVRRSA